MKSRNPDRLIRGEVVVNANLDEVWEAWTTAEGIKTFFAPNCNVDLRVDWPYEMFFDLDAQPGRRGGEGVRILAFLAYLVFWVGRQKDRSVHWSELLPALGVAGGLLIALAGFAVIGSPLPGDPVEMLAGMTLCFFLPGMGIIALSALFWWWSRGRFRVSEESADTLVVSPVEYEEVVETEGDSGNME